MSIGIVMGSDSDWPVMRAAAEAVATHIRSSIHSLEFDADANAGEDATPDADPAT